jgi:hypothetical protein
MKEIYKRRDGEKKDVSSYWMVLSKKTILELERGTLDRPQWRTDCGRVYGRIIRQNTL